MPIFTQLDLYKIFFQGRPVATLPLIEALPLKLHLMLVAVGHPGKTITQNGLTIEVQEGALRAN